MAKRKSPKVDGSKSRGEISQDHLAKVAAAKAAQIVKQGARVIIAMLYQIADNALKSGRASGNVYMRNGRIRKMVVPALVQNGHTTPVRSLLSSLSSAWNGLTDEERQSWNSATSYFRSNRFGTSFQVKGKNLFIGMNANLINTGNSPINDCPLPEDVNGITELSMVADASTNDITMTFAPSPTDAGVAHQVYATAQLSAGTYRPSASAFRLVETIAPATATGHVLSFNYTSRFGNLAAGGKVFIKLVPISIATGQAGAGIVASTVIVP